MLECGEAPSSFRHQPSVHTLMRVGIDLSCLLARPLTGVGYYTLHLLEAFRQRYPEVELVPFLSGMTPPSAEVRAFLKPWPHAHYIRFPTRLRLMLWMRLGLPPIEFFCGRVDIAHGAFHAVPPARRAVRVVTVFDLAALRYPECFSPDRLRDRLVRHAVKDVHAVFVISEYIRADLAEYFSLSLDRIHVVPAGVDLSFFCRDVEADRLAEFRMRYGLEKPYFLHIGTVEPRKNLVRLLEAYAQAKSRASELPLLVLVGAEGRRSAELWEKRASLGLERDVFHMKYLPREELFLALKGAFALVYPSLYEGFGLPVVEAMAAGVPVLTSARSAMSEAAGDAAIYVEATSVESIAEGLLRLCEESVREREKRIACGRARALRYSWENSAEALRQAYGAVLGEPRA